MSPRALVLLVALPLAWACTPPGPAGQTTPRHDPNVITSEELQTANASNLYDAVRTLRPEWLTRQAPQAIQNANTDFPVLVYMDRIRLGEPSMLRQVGIGAALELRWYSASAAQAEFGLSSGMQGVIQVVTHRR